MPSSPIRHVALVLVLLLVDATVLQAAPGEVDPLPKEWSPLGMITGFHTLSHKASGLDLRVLEADGSSSVAENPIQLFIVATNQGTSDLVEHIWLVPKTVSRVRKVASTSCGLTLLVDLDIAQEDSPFPAHKPINLRACFIGPKGNLETKLKISEEKAGAASTTNDSAEARPAKTRR